MFKVPELWGVINLTPDSFYAGSRAGVEDAVRRAASMFDNGAAAVDVGAESTRPGATDVSARDQLAVLIPFLEACAHEQGPAILKKISVDTRDVSVMTEVTKRGVGYINDVSGGSDAIYAAIAAADVQYVLMHTQGTPGNMQAAPQYADVVGEVESYLLEKTGQLRAAGVEAARIIWDAGIGFGKTVEHNLQLIAAHARLQSHGYRMLAGVSRKSFIGKILGQNEPADRLAGTLAVQSYLTLHGCDILRVHDVKEMADSLKILAAIREHEL